MKIKKTKKELFTFDGDVKFEIQPLKFSNVRLDDSTTSIKNQFTYCLCGWKGLTDEDDKEFEYNEKNKEYLYDHYSNVREFVFECVNKLQEKLDGDLKN